MSNNTQAQEAKYFDLHTTGIGYLNRIREVPIRRGEPFLAATVAALHGAADSVEYSYIDCKWSAPKLKSLSAVARKQSRPRRRC